MITLLRVLFGFIVACLVAGVVTVAFVITPADIAALPAEAQPERLGNAGVLSLLAATHSAIFALPFALIVIVIAEWSRVRSWIYYVLVGIAIALGGFWRRVPERGRRASRRSSTTMRCGAFLAVGILSGLAYWLVAGRRAGGKRGDDGRRTAGAAAARPTPSDKLAGRRARRSHGAFVDRFTTAAHRAIVLLQRSSRVYHFPQPAGGRRRRKARPHGRSAPPGALHPPLRRCRLRLFGRQHRRLRGVRRSGAELLVERAAAPRGATPQRGAGRFPWRRPAPGCFAQFHALRLACAALRRHRALPTNPWEAMSAFARP